MNDSGKAPRIKVTKDGPYIVTGGVPLVRENIIIGEDGEPEKWEMGPAFPRRETRSLCRCGASKDKPFCDGSHVEAGFDGTETANREGYLGRADRTIGPAST